MGHYLKKDRLEDVVRFIQIAGLRPTFQSHDIGTTNFLGKPRSASSWFDIAMEHPELFRVAGEAEDPRQRPLSILARYFLQDEAVNQPNRPPPTFDEVNHLVEIALKIHERQIRDRERQKAYLAVVAAIGAALIAGFFAWATKK